MSEQETITAFDAGLLNDYGGGNVQWWQDYIRSLLDKAHDHYAEQLAAANEDIGHWKVKATCYGNMVHGCSPALADAGFPVDDEQADGAVGGIARAVKAMAKQLAAERERGDKAEAENTRLRQVIARVNAMSMDLAQCDDQRSQNAKRHKV
jgi:hypothetical protein